MAQWFKKMKERHKAIFQLIGFSLVGTSALLVLFMFYSAGVLLGFSTQVSNLIGYAASTVYSYLLNFVFVFNGKKNAKNDSALRFFVLYIILYGFTAFLVWVYGELHINKWLTPFLNSALITLPSFLGTKYWVFPKEKAEK